jgi:hypothetical protein
MVGVVVDGWSRAARRVSVRHGRWLVAVGFVSVIVGTLVVVAGRSSASISTAKCVLARPPSSTSQAAPERSLLASFAVLRRPREPGDSLGSRRYLSFNQEVFVRYIRRARVVAGIAYYVIRAIFATCEPGPAYWGVSFEDMAASGTGPGGGTDAKAASVEQRGLFLGTGSRNGQTLAGLVPDGVATVALRFAADPVAAISTRTLNAKVIDNVVVVSVRGRLGSALPVGMVWRAASGEIVKTVTFGR